ncbi:excisionase [Streptomyces badius]
MTFPPGEGGCNDVQSPPRAGVRFIRRLICGRRIRYVKLGKHVRIAESVLTADVEDRTGELVRGRRVGIGPVA